MSTNVEILTQDINFLFSSSICTQNELHSVAKLTIPQTNVPVLPIGVETVAGMH